MDCTLSGLWLMEKHQQWGRPFLKKLEEYDTGADQKPRLSVRIHRDLVQAQKGRAQPKLRPFDEFCEFYWQLLSLIVPMRVCQLKVPFAARYSLVYQNVQSSTGSTVMAL